MGGVEEVVREADAELCVTLGSGSGERGWAARWGSRAGKDQSQSDRLSTHVPPILQAPRGATFTGVEKTILGWKPRRAAEAPRGNQLTGGQGRAPHTAPQPPSDPAIAWLPGDRLVGKVC